MNIDVVVLAVAWLLGWYLCWRIHAVPYVGLAGPTSACASVVIPARNEERTLPTVLAALASQTAPPYEVIVVDDGSGDTTAAVASARGARVIRAGPLPPGWTGKTWALFQGVRAARSETVVCVDADANPSSHLLARLEADFASRGGLVSVQPYHEMRRWWERAAAFFNVVAVMGVGLASPGNSRARRQAAFGPCMIARREAFLKHLGHRSVRRAITEDIALARRFSASGEPVICFAGGDLIAFRMYDHPGRLVEGFAKNFAVGARTTPPARIAGIVLWITGCLLAAIDALSGTPVALLIFVAFAGQFFLMTRQLGDFGIVAAVGYPILAVVFVATFVLSCVLLIRGEVRWRERTIRLRESS